MERIRQHIFALPEGTPFSVRELLSLGTRAAVDQALSRLVRAGTIMRLKRGVFVRPRESQYLGKMTPEPASIARLVASSSGGVLEIHGAEAARRFGFTTQVPTQPVFYTSGPARRFQLGKLQVVMKHVNPQRLTLAGTPAGAALSALLYLGKHGVNRQVVETVKAKLPHEEFEKLTAATEAMPGWLIAALRTERAASRHA